MNLQVCRRCGQFDDECQCCSGAVLATAVERMLRDVDVPAMPPRCCGSAMELQIKGGQGRDDVYQCAKCGRCRR